MDLTTDNSGIEKRLLILGMPQDARHQRLKTKKRIIDEKELDREYIELYDTYLKQYSDF